MGTTDLVTAGIDALHDIVEEGDFGLGVLVALDLCAQPVTVEFVASLNAGELAQRRFREIARVSGLVFPGMASEVETLSADERTTLVRHLGADEREEEVLEEHPAEERHGEGLHEPVHEEGHEEPFRLPAHAGHEERASAA